MTPKTTDVEVPIRNLFLPPLASLRIQILARSQRVGRRSVVVRPHVQADQIPVPISNLTLRFLVQPGDFLPLPETPVLQLIIFNTPWCTDQVMKMGSPPALELQTPHPAGPSTPPPRPPTPELLHVPTHKRSVHREILGPSLRHHDEPTDLRPGIAQTGPMKIPPTASRERPNIAPLRSLLGSQDELRHTLIATLHQGRSVTDEVEHVTPHSRFRFGGVRGGSPARYRPTGRSPADRSVVPFHDAKLSDDVHPIPLSHDLSPFCLVKRPLPKPSSLVQEESHYPDSIDMTWELFRCSLYPWVNLAPRQSSYKWGPTWPWASPTHS